jgi:hypothetical protein
LSLEAPVVPLVEELAAAELAVAVAAVTVDESALEPLEVVPAGEPDCAATA